MNERGGSKVSRTLREAIVRLELRPGTILDEAELAEKLNVSRTPIREAIIQLIADGLVEREGRKAKVASLDFDDVPRLYDALLISSRLVHRLAAENRTERDLEIIAKHMHAFETYVENGNGVLRSEANMDFHIAISAAAGNRYISGFYEQVLVGTIRIARACFSDRIDDALSEKGRQLRTHLETTMREHGEIYAAIAACDVEAADEIARKHYELTRQRMMTVLFDRSSALTKMPDLTFDSWKMA